jgi:hypothetical protein
VPRWRDAQGIQPLESLIRKISYTGPARNAIWGIPAQDRGALERGAVERAVLDRFADVMGGDCGSVFEVGYGASDLQDSRVGARG